MNVTELYCGMRARIREWDDMEAEFGCDGSGDIRTDPWFVQSMKIFCGAEITIEDFNDDGDIFVSFDDTDLAYESNDYGFSISMIEPIENNNPIIESNTFDIL